MSTVSNIDDEWNNFISSTYDKHVAEENNTINNNNNINNENITNSEIPKATEIYISTKSKIAYLNQEMDLNSIFWNIPIESYGTASNCVIKKQMKFNSLVEEELNIIKENLKKENYYEEQIITSINNPNGRIKFKDIRKVSIGLSKKDIMSYRCKKKSAFYNCFVIIIRIKINHIFKEFHVKVFNTGKIEIPGIQTDYIFEEVLKNILLILQPHIKEEVAFLQKSDTILINSNFNCGFYINREVLFDILKIKYNIQAIYDPCSYPGIQCKFYFNKEQEVQTGFKSTKDEIKIKVKKNKKNKVDKNNINIDSLVEMPDFIESTFDVDVDDNVVAVLPIEKKIEVSFMIFRTGSILIVGMCDEHVIYKIYEFLKNILITEFRKINQQIITDENRIVKDKKKKIRRKIISISV